VDRRRLGAAPIAARLPRTALLLTAILVVSDLGLRALSVAATGGAPEVFGTALVGAAFACIAGLLARRGRRGALVAAGAASGLAALDVVGVAQAERALLDPTAWRPWLASAEAALVAAAAVAAASVIVATQSSSMDRFPTVARRAAVTGLVGVIVVAAWTFLSPPPASDGHADASSLRLAGRAALGFAGLAIIAALWLASRRMIERAWTSGGGDSPTAVRLAKLPGALVDELASPARQRAAEAERARIAADIHARLLPGLRRAAIAATDPGVPPSVALDVRAAMSDAEALMESRQSLVLETYGLVAALEWLAERTQTENGIEVFVELDDATDALPIPSEVARSVFRVALLAVDNAVRHGHPARIVLGLAREGALARLRVTDDGVGIEAASAGRGGGGTGSRPGRGARDMTEEADAIRGHLSISAASPGTRVELAWPIPIVAGDHAMTPAGIPDGPGLTAG